MDGITETTRKIRATAAVFELPQKLGILQYVEYEPPPREWCSSDGCLYEGFLTAEGCRKGVCVRYRVWVHSRDRRRWEAKEKWRRRDEEAGGCIKQQVADALWELSDRFDVGVWYKRVEEKVGMFRYETYVYCGPVVNGVELDQPRCRSAEECAKQILEDYKREVERRSEPPPPPPPDPAEELLREWPELQAFGVEWVREWMVNPYKEHLVEIAKVLRKFPWMVEVVKQRPMNFLHPYMVEVYVAKDGSEACLSLNPPKAYCIQNGTVKEVRLELERIRYEPYEDKLRDVYRPKAKGLLAFAAAARREYVRIL
jgi:hypothetical protein